MLLATIGKFYVVPIDFGPITDLNLDKGFFSLIVILLKGMMYRD